MNCKYFDHGLFVFMFDISLQYIKKLLLQDRLLEEIEERLYSKGVEVQTGYKGKRFFQDRK